MKTESCLRSLKALSAALLVLAISGCSLFGRAPALAPAGFELSHSPESLTDPATMSAAYRQLFPARAYLRVSYADLTDDFTAGTAILSPCL